MKTIPCIDTTSCDEIVRQAEHDDLILTRDGHAVALVMPFDDDDVEWYARERDPEFLASIARGRHQVETGRTVSHADLKKELGLK